MQTYLISIVVLVIAALSNVANASCTDSPYSSACEGSAAHCRLSPYASACEGSSQHCDLSPYASACEGSSPHCAVSPYSSACNQSTEPTNPGDRDDDGNGETLREQLRREARCRNNPAMCK